MSQIQLSFGCFLLGVATINYDEWRIEEEQMAVPDFKRYDSSNKRSSCLFGDQNTRYDL